MSKKKFGERMNGKGYYIALILCAAAIGISGYVYYRNANDTKESELQNQDAVSADAVGEEDVEAAASNGDTERTDTTVSDGDSESTEGTKASKPARTSAPVTGETIAAFCMDALSYNQTTRDWRVHDGIDYAGEAGTSVCAAADGTVYSVYEDDTMGMTVVIRHEGGYLTRYASLTSEMVVSPGDTVEAGQTIGYVGSTALLESAIGDHVHFSVSCNGEVVDPEEFLAQE